MVLMFSGLRQNGHLCSSDRQDFWDYDRYPDPPLTGKQLESMLRLRIVQCPGNVKCSEDPASLSRRCTEIMV
eukprot:1615154-Prorocentrum_lima.AAC.1